MNLLVETIFFAIIILAIDIPWILFYMQSVYVQVLAKNNLNLSGHVMAPILAYLVMILSYPLLLYDKNKTKMLGRAMALGFVIYGTYGFTLSSFLPHYTLDIALKEVIWGTFLYTLSCLITNKISNLFN